MSLARAALRIAAVEALRPYTSLPDGPFPTLAGRYVFDTRLDPIHDLAADERRPIAVIYTEEDNGDPLAQSGPRYYDRTVDLVAELSVPATYTPADGAPFVAPAVSDAALEFMLDLFELQVRFVLHYGPSGAWFRKIATTPAIDFRSLPFRDSEEGVRLAFRTVRMQYKLKVEDTFDPTPLTAPTGLDRLPEPLKSFMQSLPVDHYARQIAAGLADAVPVMPVRAPLKTVSLGGKATAPDGTIPATPNVQGVVENIDQ